MKGIISGIKRMEIHDGDGLRTTVFFKGCPLKCVWCHNPESISFTPQAAKFADKCISCGLCMDKRTAEVAENCPTGALVFYGETVDSDTLADKLEQDRPFFEQSGGGVTLSGGECLAQPDFAVALAKRLYEKGINVYVDTSGYAPWEVIERIIPYTDTFLYDIKAIDSRVHKTCTGRENGIILENLRRLLKRGCSVEIRYPLVVGLNDGECEKIGEFLSSAGKIKRIKALKYHNFAASRYEALGMKNTLPAPKTEREDVERAVNILRSFGLPAVNGMDSD